jgi:hypothetical protein
MLVEHNSEGTAEDEKHSTIDLEPNSLLFLKVGHLDHDHHSEDPHDQLCLTETKKSLEDSAILTGGLWTGTRFRLNCLGMFIKFVLIDLPKRFLISHQIDLFKSKLVSQKVPH